MARKIPRYLALACSIFICPLTLCPLLGAVVFMAAPQVPLRIAGFKPEGNVEDYWAEAGQRATPVDLENDEQILRLIEEDLLSPASETPAAVTATVAADAPTGIPTEASQVHATPTRTPDRQTPTLAQVPTATASGTVAATEPVQQLTFTAQGVSATLSIEETLAESVLVFQGNGGQTGVLRYHEDNAIELCAVFLIDCRTDRYRVFSADFRQDGVIVYGSINAGFWWQDLGVAMNLNHDRLTFAPIGTVVDGGLYSVPAKGTVHDVIIEATAHGNNVLTTLRVGFDDVVLDLSRVYVNDTYMVLLFR